MEVALNGPDMNLRQRRQMAHGVVIRGGEERRTDVQQAELAAAGACLDQTRGQLRLGSAVIRPEGQQLQRSAAAAKDPVCFT